MSPVRLQVFSQKTYNKILLKFFVLILLLTLPSIIITSYSKKLLINYIYNSNKPYIETIATNFDHSLNNIWDKAYQLTVDDEINEILHIEYGNPHFSNLTSRIHTKLSNTFGGDTLIDDVYLFLRNLEFLLTLDGSFEKSYFFNEYFSYDNYSLDFWNNILEQRIKTLLLPSSLTYVNNNKAETRNAYHRLMPMITPIDYSHQPNGYVIVNINENMLYNSKGITIPQHSNIYVISLDSNEILSSTDKDSIGKNFNVSYHDFQSNHSLNRTTINIDNIDYVYNFKESDFSSFFYVMLIPEKALTSQIQNFSFMTLILIILFVFIGMTFSTLFTHNIYTPLSNTIDFIKNTVAQSNTEIKNEYDFIKSNFMNYENQQRKVIPSLAQSVLYKHIHSNLSKEELKLFQNQYKFFSKTSHFLIVVIRFEQSQQLSEDILDSLFSTLKDIVIKYSLPIDLFVNEYILLMNGADSENTINEFDKMVEDLSIFVNTNSEKLSCVLSRSNCFNDLTDIKTAYRAASSILDFRNVNINKVYYIIEDAGNSEKMFITYETKYALRNHVENGNISEVQNILSSLFSNFVSKNIVFIRYRELFSELILMLLDIVYSNKFDMHNDLSVNYDIFTLIKKMQIPKTMESFCMDLYTKFASIKNKENKEDELLCFIFEYVQKNLSKVYLNGLAYNIGMNPNYLSQYFKKKTGVTFTSYVNHAKINTAKDQLANTDKKIQDISKDVGFNNQSAFIRMFKKL